MPKPHPRHRRVLVAIVGALLLSLAVNVAGFFYMHLREDQRMAFAASVGFGRFQSGPTVIVGDSIIAALKDGGGRAINLATSGATIGWIATHQLDVISSLQPGRLIVSAGVNDLRAGAAPEQVAVGLVSLAKDLRARIPTADITLLAVLPLSRNSPLAGSLNANSSASANEFIRAKAIHHGFRFLDHASMFSDINGLRDDLTYDGLHLNAAGTSILADIVFNGIAGTWQENSH